jgi:hypothetical protein
MTIIVGTASIGEGMVELVVKLGLRREPGHLYFVADGKIYRRRMMRTSEREKSNQPERGPGPEDVVVDLKLKQDPNYNYFVDQNGDISRAPKQDWEK